MSTEAQKAQSAIVETGQQRGVSAVNSDSAPEAAAAENLPGFCPVADTLHLMHEKWTLHIVYVLLSGKKRFNEIGHAMGGVNARTLRERLRGLETEGIVERRVLSAMPPWVEYELTEKGLALSEVMDAMSRWARRWHQPCGDARSSTKTGQGGDNGTEPRDG